jgi:hypothetical protein
MNLIDSNNQPAPASVEQSLQAAIDAFKGAPASGVATNLLRANASTVQAEEAPVIVEPDLAEPQPTEQEPTEETEDQPEPSAEFGEQFKAVFGMDTTEAVSLVNELANFRDEVQLMRQWGVAAHEYDSRIGAVKEFFGTLPEDSREQFNTPQGAIAIWNHLEKTGKVAPSTQRSGRAKSSVRSSTSKPPAAELLKRSEILAMDDNTYRANYARISKAFQEGRVID